MKLRHPYMIRFASWAGAGLIRGLVSTLRVRSDSRGQQTDPWDPTLKERFLYVLWHENLSVAFALRAAAPVRILISQSADGELLSQLANRFGVETVRGSTGHGGAEAMDHLLETSHTSHLLTAPDGPQGPPHKVHRGFAYLASRTGMRVVPFGVGFSRSWRASSWDRTHIPKPGSLMTIVAGPIIQVPPNVGKRGLEQYRLLIEQSIDAANNAAVAWATGEKRVITWPEVPAQAA
jgi:lysophospholipid acyltransferase (LPLAT)-like uncharacterized protein